MKAPKERALMLYHAFEIYTESMVHIYAHPDKTLADEQFERYWNHLKDEIETYSLGTVQATSWEEAINAIRMGDWEFTQYV